MFNRKPQEETELEKAIRDVLTQLRDMDPKSDEYSKVADQLSKLYKLKEIDSPPRVTPDAWVGAAASIVGIAMILGWEKAHIVTSKALSFVRTTR